MKILVTILRKIIIIILIRMKLLIINKEFKELKN